MRIAHRAPPIRTNASLTPATTMCSRQGRSGPLAEITNRAVGGKRVRVIRVR
jgi:hypothetical protein